MRGRQEFMSIKMEVSRSDSRACTICSKATVRSINSSWQLDFNARPLISSWLSKWEIVCFADIF